ncbi:hypothetical protein [Pseudoalteromonas phage J2-1_QLiu-2017]|nr:hypothetical protein [Pseudoalteromonas phage J2-1_QLiu-2017]
MISDFFKGIVVGMLPTQAPNHTEAPIKHPEVTNEPPKVVEPIKVNISPEGQTESVTHLHISMMVKLSYYTVAFTEEPNMEALKAAIMKVHKAKKINLPIAEINKKVYEMHNNFLASCGGKYHLGTAKKNIMKIVPNLDLNGILSEYVLNMVVEVATAYDPKHKKFAESLKKSLTTK